MARAGRGEFFSSIDAITGFRVRVTYAGASAKYRPDVVFSGGKMTVAKYIARREPGEQIKQTRDADVTVSGPPERGTERGLKSEKAYRRNTYTYLFICRWSRTEEENQ